MWTRSEIQRVQVTIKRAHCCRMDYGEPVRKATTLVRVQRYTCIDLFAGAGGLSLGLKQAGFRCVLANEIDEFASQTFGANFPDAPLIMGDVQSIDFKAYRGNVDLVAGGPPCQPFSVAGLQKSHKDERNMIPQFVRAVREARPRAFLMENVPGLTTPRHRDYLRSVIVDLAGLGYFVEGTVLDAASFGAPQHRRRLFLVGMRDALFDFPPATHGPGEKYPHVNARTVIGATPPDVPNRAIVTYARHPIMRPSPYAGMLVNGQGRPINLDRPSPTIPASAGGNRTHIVDYDGILLRYHSELLAGATPRVGRVPGVRRLTIRESARLQTFPDDFEFFGRRSSQYSQIGNAVPPLLAREIASAIARTLARTEEIVQEARPARPKREYVGESVRRFEATLA